MNDRAQAVVLQRRILLVLLVLIYAALVVTLDFLSFPIRKDERYFWPVTLHFSQSLLPSLETLRSYAHGVVTTPLSFVIFGTLEYLFQGGIAVGRWLNVLLSAALVYGIGRSDQEGDWSGLRAAGGLLLFPYYLGVSAHLYTDILAALFGVAGLALHLRGRHAAAAVAFVLAISTRQYLLAFPLALCGYEAVEAWRGRTTSVSAWLAPLLASLSILGWIALFGGLVPRADPAQLPLDTAAVGVLHPSHALYFLVCIGAYFVLPEWVLFSRRLTLSRRAAWRSGVVAVGVLALFLLFPPLRNPVGVPAMGYLDVAVRMIAPDWLRLALYGGLATLACLRLGRWDPAGVLLLANAAVLLKSHIAWDKYALPMLAALWLLRATHALREPERAAVPHRVAGPAQDHP